LISNDDGAALGSDIRAMNFELIKAGVSLALQLGKVVLRLGPTPLVNACPLTLIERAAATWEVLVEKDGFAVGDHCRLPVALCQSFCQQCDQVLFIWPQGTGLNCP
jgi:hypothetical protein